MITLDKLSLEELTDLSITLAVIADAGRALVSSGAVPIFDLTPGHEITIRTGRKMPVVGPKGAFGYQGLDFGRSDQTVKIEIEHPEVAKPAQTGTGPQAPAGESAGGGVRVTAVPGCEAEPLLAEAAPAATEAEGDRAAPAPAKTPGAVGSPPPSAGALVTGPLSDEEKQSILNLTSEGYCAKTIAELLCRRTNLVSMFLTFQAKKSANEPTQPDPGPPDPGIIPEQTGGPSSPAVSDGAGSIAGQDMAAPAPDAPKPAPVAPKPAPAGDGLAAYLTNLPRKNGWTLALDAELMRLACLGWKFHHVEADLGVQGAKARFELLTDSRSYPREKVNAALAAMQPEKA